MYKCPTEKTSNWINICNNKVVAIGLFLINQNTQLLNGEALFCPYVVDMTFTRLSANANQPNLGPLAKTNSNVENKCLHSSESTYY